MFSRRFAAQRAAGPLAHLAGLGPAGHFAKRRFAGDNQQSRQTPTTLVISTSPRQRIGPGFVTLAQRTAPVDPGTERRADPFPPARRRLRPRFDAPLRPPQSLDLLRRPARAGGDGRPRRRARRRRLALTDHDEIGGLAEARAAAAAAGITLVAGAELSVSWEDLTIHVVGAGHRPGQRRAGQRACRDPRRAACCARGASPTRWPKPAFAAPTRARANS